MAQAPCLHASSLLALSNILTLLWFCAAWCAPRTSAYACIWPLSGRCRDTPALLHQAGPCCTLNFHCNP